MFLPKFRLLGLRWFVGFVWDPTRKLLTCIEEGGGGGGTLGTGLDERLAADRWRLKFDSGAGCSLAQRRNVGRRQRNGDHSLSTFKRQGHQFRAASAQPEVFDPLDRLFVGNQLRPGKRPRIDLKQLPLLQVMKRSCAFRIGALGEHGSSVRERVPACAQLSGRLLAHSSEPRLVRPEVPLVLPMMLHLSPW